MGNGANGRENPGVSREILRLLSCGHSPAAIAAMLGLSMRDMRRITKGARAA